jgi:hypothetical protein
MQLQHHLDGQQPISPGLSNQEPDPQVFSRLAIMITLFFFWNVFEVASTWARLVLLLLGGINCASAVVGLRFFRTNVVNAHYRRLWDAQILFVPSVMYLSMAVWNTYVLLGGRQALALTFFEASLLALLPSLIFWILKKDAQSRGRQFKGRRHVWLGCAGVLGGVLSSLLGGWPLQQKIFVLVGCNVLLGSCMALICTARLLAIIVRTSKYGHLAALKR